MIPDGVEPSLPGCHPGVFAVGPRDQTSVLTKASTLEKWTYRDLHPDFWYATPVSSYWTISPLFKTSKHISAPRHFKLRGQESNLRTRGSKPRISTSRNYPAMFCYDSRLVL